MKMPTAAISNLPAIPKGVRTLSFREHVHISSEMIHAVLPIYLNLGATTLPVGFIEGIAEATASSNKIFSAALSYWLGRRAFLAALG